MLINTTYNNKKNKALVDDKVGDAFTFIEIIKLRGIGSKRMQIDKVSPNMAHILNTISDANYGNIELRPKGILVLINKGLQNYTWIIPYYKLVLYKVNGSSIHADGKFIHFLNNKNLRENKKFFNKLINQKVNYDEQFNFFPI